MQESIISILVQLDKQLSQRICARVKHDDCCEDILQDVYLKALQRLPQLEKAENLASYMMKMADNAVVDYFRKKGKVCAEVAVVEDTPAPADQPNDLVARLSVSFVGQMIDTLPPIYRDALVRTEIEGVSQKQLAVELVKEMEIWHMSSFVLQAQPHSLLIRPMPWFPAMVGMPRFRMAWITSLGQMLYPTRSPGQ